MVDILKKAGPLGEKLGSSLGGARNLNFSNPLDAFDKLGFAQLLSGGLGGIKSGLSYPLDVAGNPAYNATIRFKVRKYTTPDGKSQKEMDKQIEDNLKKQGATPFFADDAAASGVGGATGLAASQDFSDFGSGGALGGSGAIGLDAFGGAGDDVSAVAGSAKDAVKDNANEIQALKKATSVLQSGMRFLDEDNAPTVLMYMPASIAFNDGAIYDNNAALGALGATAEASFQAGVGGVIDSLKQSVGQGLSSTFDLARGNFEAGEQAGLLALQRLNENFKPLGSGVQNAITLQTRMIVNPNVRSIFRGVALREFTFQFKMISNSRAEARAIEKIIKHFRAEMYPDIFSVSIGDQQAQLGYKFPNAFKISFHFNGVENRKIPKLKECYLRNVQHTINPTGGGFRTDGQPNEIDLTLSFVEHETLNRKDIEDGGF